jgi:hypothetical protein
LKPTSPSMQLCQDKDYDNNFPENYDWKKIIDPELRIIATSIKRIFKDRASISEEVWIAALPGLQIALRIIATYATIEVTNK